MKTPLYITSALAMLLAAGSNVYAMGKKSPPVEIVQVSVITPISEQELHAHVKQIIEYENRNLIDKALFESFNLMGKIERSYKLNSNLVSAKLQFTSILKEVIASSTSTNNKLDAGLNINLFTLLGLNAAISESLDNYEEFTRWIEVNSIERNRFKYKIQETINKANAVLADQLSLVYPVLYLQKTVVIKALQLLLKKEVKTFDDVSAINKAYMQVKTLSYLGKLRGNIDLLLCQTKQHASTKSHSYSDTGIKAAANLLGSTFGFNYAESNKTDNKTYTYSETDCSTQERKIEVDYSNKNEFYTLISLDQKIESLSKAIEIRQMTSNPIEDLRVLDFGNPFLTKKGN